MTRVEVIGNATLYCGDSREIVPTLAGRFGRVVSDPPYGIGTMVGGYGRAGRTIQNDSNLDVCIEVLEACARAMPAGWIAAFYSCRVSDIFFDRMNALDVPGLAYFGELIWDKKAPGMGNPLRYSHENIALFQVGEPAPLGATFSIIRGFRAGGVHPHEKPVPLMQQLCTIMGQGAVLDPFMGSGSTGVGCAASGDHFIGIELDPAYFDIACERIATAQKQVRLFAPPAPAVAEGEGLFAA